MCLPNLENLTFSIPIFRSITHPIVYHFQKKSTQFCQNWVLFTIICSKYTQFLNLGSFVSVEDPPIAIPNFAKRHLKRQAHIRIPCQCEDPPGLICTYKAKSRHVILLPVYVLYRKPGVKFKTWFNVVKKPYQKIPLVIMIQKRV